MYSKVKSIALLVLLLADFSALGHSRSDEATEEAYQSLVGEGNLLFAPLARSELTLYSRSIGGTKMAVLGAYIGHSICKSRKALRFTILLTKLTGIVIGMLLIMSGDVEENPGPVFSQGNVMLSDTGLLCIGASCFSHLDRIGMSVTAHTDSMMELWQASTHRMGQLVLITIYRPLRTIFSELHIHDLVMSLINGYYISLRALSCPAAVSRKLKESSVTRLLKSGYCLGLSVLKTNSGNLERSLVALAILLIMAGDVEQNPGPIGQRNIKTVSEYLSALSEIDLLKLGMELGLSLKTLQGYGKVSVIVYRYSLLDDWVIEKDNVKERGGATWSSLVNALRSENINHHEIADKIEAEQMGGGVTWSSLVNALRSEDVSQNEIAAKIEAEQMGGGQEEQAGDTQPPQSITRFTDYLRAFYQTSKLPAPDKWLPSPSRKYINLAAISREQVSTEEMKKFTHATLHGNVDEILKIKPPIQIKDILGKKPGEKLECVLVEGAPGVGKTTIAWEICSKWGKRQLFQQYSAVILLRLRNETVQKAKCIKDLIFHSDEGCREEIAQYLKQTDGKDMLIILEGLDELPKHLLAQSSIFTSLLSGEKLPQATILITSQPPATVQLWENWKNRISRHIEVLGFTDQDIDDYIASVMSPEECPGLIDYLSLNSTIKLMMYIPIHAAIIIEVYRYIHRSSRLLPTSVTELYTCLVQTILLRYLDTHPHYKHEKIALQKFTDLPSPLYHQFEQLVEMALQGVLNQQLTFPDQPEQIEHMGFMDIVIEYIPLATYSYNFLHVSVQEYLAAYAISLKTTEEQELLLQRTHTERYLENVGHFLVGITKFKDMDKTTVKAIIEEGCKWERTGDGGTQLQLSSYVLRLIQESGDWNIIAGYSSYYYILTDHNPLFDFLNLGQCIINSNYTWTLVLGAPHQYLQSLERIDMLLNTLKKHSSPTYAIERIDCYYDTPQYVEHLLIELPQSTLQKIRELRVEGNRENRSPLPAAVFELILSMISRLNKLWLVDTAISDSEATTIAEMLQISSTLTYLNISHNTIGDSGTTAIAEMLQRNSTLTNLNISHNAISDSGTTAIAEMLTRNNTLEFVDLSDNNMGNMGYKALEEVRQRKKDLELIYNAHPSILQHPEDVIAVTGQSVTFTCAIRGIPTPSIEWTHTGSLLDPSERVTIKRKENIVTLLIHNVKEVDKGEYCCIASNSEGKAKSNEASLLISSSNYIHDVCKQLKPLAVRWHQLGFSLNLTEDTLDKISSEFKSDEECLNAVLCEKIKMSSDINNWQRDLVEAVASRDGGNNPDIAKELTHTYRKVMEEKDLQMLEAMKQSGENLSQTIIQCLFFGFPRAGKSSLMNRLIGLPHDPNLPSTPAAKKAIQVYMSKMETKTVLLTGSSSYQWHTLSPSGEAQTLIAAAMQKTESHKLQELLTDEETMEDTQDITTSSVQHTATSQQAADHFSVPSGTISKEVVFPSFISVENDTAESDSTTTADTADYRSLQEILEDAVKDAKIEEVKEFLKKGVATLYLTDTGGQIEFQELLPALVAGHFIIFLVFDLRSNLSEPYEVKYVHPDGREAKPYQSFYTVEDTLLRSLASIVSMCSEETEQKMPKVRIIFVGTHRDKVSSQKVNEMESRLCDLVKRTTAYERDLIQEAIDGNYIVQVDNTSKNDTEFEPVRQLVEHIYKEAYCTVTAPSSWLIFGFYIRQLKIKVITYRNCYKIAKVCGIQSHEDLRNALHFLHTKLGLIRYFHGSDLEEIVIIDPQILFDRITRLITEMFTLHVTRREKDELKHEGRFSLSRLKYISRDDTDELTVERLVKLLEHLHIIAPIHGTDDFFMPCVLARSVYSDCKLPVCAYECTAPPLLVTFRGGYCPIGLFCFLSTYLIKKKSWTLIPMKIFDFSISFRVGLADIVTLVFKPAYITVLVKTKTKQTYADIKTSISVALDDIKSQLNYVHSQDANHTFAFYCTKSDCERKKQCPEHPAEFVIDNNRKSATLLCEQLPCIPPENWDLWFFLEVAEDKDNTGPEYLKQDSTNPLDKPVCLPEHIDVYKLLKPTQSGSAKRAGDGIGVRSWKNC